MHNQNPAISKVAELECKSTELIGLLFAICEKNIVAKDEQPTPERLALAASALALQKTIASFLAIEKLCK